MKSSITTRSVPGGASVMPAPRAALPLVIRARLISGDVALQFFIHPPHRNFSLCSVCRQLLVLLEFHRGGSLIFGRPARNLVLDSVSCIKKYLPHALKPGSSSPGVFGNGAMAG